MSDVQSASLALDRSGPHGTITVNGGASFASSSTVQVSALATTGAAAVAQVLLANDPTLSGGVLANAQAFAPGSPISWTLADANDGAHTVFAQWQDSYGRWSPVASAAITLDRTPPSVAVPLAALVQSAQMGSSGVPVDAVEVVSDTTSGVASTTTEFERNGGTWTQAPQGVTAGGPDAFVDASSTWQFRVSAADVAGNSAVQVVGRLFRGVVTEDTNTSIHYNGTWRKTSSSTASGGSTHYATARGATASLTFTGGSVAWVAPLGSKLGRAKVFIDGVLAATVDLRGAPQQRVLVFAKSWAVPGTHTIKIKVLGTSGRPRIDLDAFTFLT